MFRLWSDSKKSDTGLLAACLDIFASHFFSTTTKKHPREDGQWSEVKFLNEKLEGSLQSLLGIPCHVKSATAENATVKRDMIHCNQVNISLENPTTMNKPMSEFRMDIDQLLRTVLEENQGAIPNKWNLESAVTYIESWIRETPVLIDYMRVRIGGTDLFIESVNMKRNEPIDWEKLTVSRNGEPLVEFTRTLTSNEGTPRKAKGPWVTARMSDPDLESIVNTLWDLKFLIQAFGGMEFPSIELKLQNPSKFKVQLADVFITPMCEDILRIKLTKVKIVEDQPADEKKPKQDYFMLMLGLSIVLDRKYLSECVACFDGPFHIHAQGIPLPGHPTFLDNLLKLCKRMNTPKFRFLVEGSGGQVWLPNVKLSCNVFSCSATSSRFKVLSLSTFGTFQNATIRFSSRGNVHMMCSHARLNGSVSDLNKSWKDISLFSGAEVFTLHSQQIEMLNYFDVRQNDSYQYCPPIVFEFSVEEEKFTFTIPTTYVVMPKKGYAFRVLGSKPGTIEFKSRGSMALNVKFNALAILQMQLADMVSLWTQERSVSSFLPSWVENLGETFSFECETIFCCVFPMLVVAYKGVWTEPPAFPHPRASKPTVLVPNWNIRVLIQPHWTASCLDVFSGLAPPMQEPVAVLMSLGFHCWLSVWMVKLFATPIKRVCVDITKDTIELIGTALEQEAARKNHIPSNVVFKSSYLESCERLTELQKHVTLVKTFDPETKQDKLAPKDSLLPSPLSSCGVSFTYEIENLTISLFEGSEFALELSHQSLLKLKSLTTIPRVDPCNVRSTRPNKPLVCIRAGGVNFFQSEGIVKTLRVRAFSVHSGKCSEPIIAAQQEVLVGDSIYVGKSEGSKFPLHVTIIPLKIFMTPDFNSSVATIAQALWATPFLERVCLQTKIPLTRIEPIEAYLTYLYDAECPLLSTVASVHKASITFPVVDLAQATIRSGVRHILGEFKSALVSAPQIAKYVLSTSLFQPARTLHKHAGPWMEYALTQLKIRWMQGTTNVESTKEREKAEEVKGDTEWDIDWSTFDIV
eukprot:PhF_6_TR34980/c0_g1_i1/m.50813